MFMLIQYGFGSSYRNKLLGELESNERAEFTMKEIPDFKRDVKEKSSYQELVNRPLFFKVRRPIEVTDDVVQEISQVSGDFEFLLTGIINTPNAFYCLLQNPRAKGAENRFKRLEEGEVIEGRTIQEIKKDRIIIAYDGKTEEIMLSKPRPKRKHTRNPFKAAAQKNSRKPNITKPYISPEPPRQRSGPAGHRPETDRPSPATAKRNPFKLRKKYQK